MGVNGGVGVQPPNQQSSLLPDAMLHNSMNAQRYDSFSQVTATCFSVVRPLTWLSKIKNVLYWLSLKVNTH